jgi:transcriptional regulator with XRE-family HTH domain
MGQSITSARHRELGAELRKRREAAGVTGRQVAEYMGWHRTKVSRMETGHYETSSVEAIFYLGACGVLRAQALDVLQLCREAEQSAGHWLSPNGEWMETALNSLIYHESTASNLVIYEPMVVNGLLQTADYARTLISREKWRDEANVATCVGVRMTRQEVLGRPRPARFTFFVHEQALRNQVGSGAIMHEQLLQVVLLSWHDHVDLRVVPTSAAEQAAFGGSFQVLSFDRHRPLVYLDNHSTGLFLEDEEYVAAYRDLHLPLIAELAWSKGQSRRFVAAMAHEFDRGSSTPNGGIYQLEEEHF